MPTQRSQTLQKRSSTVQAVPKKSAAFSRGLNSMRHANTVGVKYGMVWKIEKWLGDVFPGKDNIYSAYRHLPRRELALVAAGSLDLALAELISKRLMDCPKECEQFLGADEDGRAPAGSFGARIQLALLLGIITPEDAAQLRIIKSIRNKFAHRINIDFTSDSIKPLVIALYDKTVVRTQALIEGGYLPVGAPQTESDMRPYFNMTPEAGAGLLLSVFCVYQAYFHRLSDMIPRIELIIRQRVILADNPTLRVARPADDESA